MGRWALSKGKKLWGRGNRAERPKVAETGPKTPLPQEDELDVEAGDDFETLEEFLAFMAGGRMRQGEAAKPMPPPTTGLTVFSIPSDGAWRLGETQGSCSSLGTTSAYSTTGRSSPVAAPPPKLQFIGIFLNGVGVTLAGHSPSGAHGAKHVVKGLLLNPSTPILPHRRYTAHVGGDACAHLLVDGNNRVCACICASEFPTLLAFELLAEVQRAYAELARGLAFIKRENAHARMATPMLKAKASRYEALGRTFSPSQWQMRCESPHAAAAAATTTDVSKPPETQNSEFDAVEVALRLSPCGTTAAAARAAATASAAGLADAELERRRRLVLWRALAVAVVAATAAFALVALLR